MRKLYAALACLLTASALAVNARADEKVMRCEVFSYADELLNPDKPKERWIIKADKDTSRISISSISEEDDKSVERPMPVTLMWADEMWQHLIAYQMIASGVFYVHSVYFSKPSVINYIIGGPGDQRMAATIRRVQEYC